MNMLISPLGVAGLAALGYALYIFANLSRRLGAVTKMRPYYRGFFVAIGFLAISALARVLLSSTVLVNDTRSVWSTSLFALVAYHVPLVIAMAIGVVVAWHYWSWLFKEKLS